MFRVIESSPAGLPILGVHVSARHQQLVNARGVVPPDLRARLYTSSIH